MNADSIVAMLSSPVNLGFMAAIACAFWFGRKASKQGKHNFVEYAPTLMTSLGLFGTFFGIFIGLIGFDTAHIDTSIGKLLDGLKTAFFTSIVGMAASIIFKVLDTKASDVVAESDDSQATNEIGPNEIYAVMNKQQQSIDLLVQAIGGGGDRSLVGQVQLMRTDINDFRSGAFKQHDAFEEKLWAQLSSFAEMLSKSATQQVIEALKQVIVEFNEKLTEQFGENFKRLDESVKKLVDWQQLYMQQLEAMIEQYQQGVQAIDATREAVQEIRVETAKIPVHMESLGEVVQVNQHQLSELGRHLEAFVLMRDQAVIAVPHIQKKLEEVGEQLRAGADQINLELVRGANEYKASVQETGVTMRNIGHELAEHSSGISKELSDAFTLLELNTERIRTGVTSTISSAMEAIETSTKQTVEATGEAVTSVLTQVQQGIDASSQAYGQQLSRSLETIETSTKQTIAATSEAVTGVLTQVQQGIDASSQAYGQQLSRSFEAIEMSTKQTVEATGEAVTGVLTQVQQGIEASSQAYSKQLSRSLEAIETSTNQTIAATSEVVTGVLTQVQQGIDASSQAYSQQLGRSLEAIETASKHAVDATGEAVTGLLTKAQQGLDANNQAYNQHLSRSLDSLESHAKDMLSKTNEGVNKQIVKFDKAMEEELNKALRDLGSALKTIHEHLVKDVYKGQVKERLFSDQ